MAGAAAAMLVMTVVDHATLGKDLPLGALSLPLAELAGVGGGAAAGEGWFGLALGGVEAGALRLAGLLCASNFTSIDSCTPVVYFCNVGGCLRRPADDPVRRRDPPLQQVAAGHYIAMSGEVIFMPPCLFCMGNH